MIRAAIPLPIQIVIDDVGWWSGENGSARGEPFRTGIARDHVPADYEAIAELGRRLKMRPQAAMILCEWDTNNILRRLPSCTWMGSDWDNTRCVGPWLEEAADILRRNSAHIEITLHGIGHEFWAHDAAGKWNFTRAEWHDGDGVMRPRAEVLARLELYAQLMAEHDLGSFPTSFVPCAFYHRFGGEDENLAALLQRVGINFISTPFSSMHNAEETQHKTFGFDHGILTVDRGRDVLRWTEIGQPPRGELNGPICGLHWPNILHPDPNRNGEIVDAWVSYLQEYNRRLDTMLAPDTNAFATQLLRHCATKYQIQGNNIVLDETEYSGLPLSRFDGKFLLKIESDKPLQFSSDQLQIESVEEIHTAQSTLYTLALRNRSGQKIARLQFA